MDIIKSARNIMALPSVAVLATELQVLVSFSMIPITLLPQAISHGGREAGSIFYATEMVELADEIWRHTDKGGGGGAGQSNDSVKIADR